MILLDLNMEPTHDINAEVEGFLGTKQLALYEESDTIPTLMNKYIDPPLLMIEVIDDELHTNLFDSTTGREIMLMKPLCAIAITKEQAQFIKKYYAGKE